MSDFKLIYQYKDTTLVQPEVRFGDYPPSKTEKKFVSRHVYKKENSSQEIWRKSELLELKEFVKEQYWVLVDFFHGQPGGREREISYTRETGLTIQRFEEIASKLGIRSSQELGADGFKLRYKVSQELSRSTSESITIAEKTSKKHTTKIPPQSFEWYFAIYQLIDVYTINTVHLNPSYNLKLTIKVLASRSKDREVIAKEDLAADIAKRNFESGLKQYSGNSDYTFKSETFEVPTLYFCEKCDPPLK
ncbi:MAG: hypothetical protein F6K18_26705 [Okeania sp. SIO2C2]|uniref:hypothetical protein n=1 Tax=Okeania sp. SIO2C2 TaxID=2607787 RepID=UPI0013B5C7AB|nr:hypothetical protein [Okeania sp. SIO2C2]NEP90126.1 hypothetical protein [Okeania sp. SIO2C2]